MQNYSRRPTHSVFVGDIGIGGQFPIRIQSMATSDTKDTVSLVREIEDLANAGCEIVRITVPTKADCQNLINVRRELQQKRIKVPLVADIHFTPSVAMDVVEYVEKVRINPGNFVDKKLFKTNEYTDEQYLQELARIEESFTPLVEKCKVHGVAMRIGTNHGSLSDRIMNRYGDTPEGMVESALEFLRIAEKLNYRDIVLSMKASNTQVMVTAYRLLAKRLAEENMTHPFHLGVTEAGDAEDGRIKSAVGIGTLLQQGLGDTIRVSLTEDSIHEIPVAGMIVAPFNEKFYTNLFNAQGKSKSVARFDIHSLNYKPQYVRRTSHACTTGTHTLGGSNTPQIWLAIHTEQNLESVLSRTVKSGEFEGVELSQQLVSSVTIEKLKSKNLAIAAEIQASSSKEFQHLDKWIIPVEINSTSDVNTILDRKPAHIHAEFCLSSKLMDSQSCQSMLKHIQTQLFDRDITNVSFSVASRSPETQYLKLCADLAQLKITAPLNLRYQQDVLPVQTDASMKLGSLLLDGIGDSVVINSDATVEESLSYTQSLLQACRVRTSKTEFIACPSCGRTLFNLQDVTAKIKSRTSHLKGLKIAIMGCIVNGPGEMADADFGYVGTGTGRISLYVGKDCVTRNIPEEQALDSLIGLIKQHDRWTDPEAA